MCLTERVHRSETDGERVSADSHACMMDSALRMDCDSKKLGGQWQKHIDMRTAQ